MEDRERLHNLHLALEAALEQLTYALKYTTLGTEIGSRPSSDTETIERALGEVTTLRNQVRQRLMTSMAKPTLNIIK
jgi:hypothetical protein